MFPGKQVFACLGWLAIASSGFLHDQRCFAQAVDAAPDVATPKQRLTVATTRFGVVNLMDIDLDGKEATQRTTDQSGEDEPAWSPDGSQLAYVSYRTGRRQVYITAADGTGERRLTESSRDARCPGWTADGKRLVYVDDRSGRAEVYAIDADGKNEVNLSQHPSSDADPAWSAHGKQVLFTSDRAANRAFRLFIMDADGGKQRELVPKDLIGWVYPATSPDGKQVAFGSAAPNGTVQVFSVNLDGTGLQQLTFGTLSHSWPAWSPDGQYLAYVEYEVSKSVNANNINPGTGDLGIYDTINDVHMEISLSDISLSGPRPS